MTMDFAFLVPLLAMTTMLIVIVLALVSKKKVDQKRRDPNAPKSSLAADAPNTGAR
jgi:hypothetical protein